VRSGDESARALENASHEPTPEGRDEDLVLRLGDLLRLVYRHDSSRRISADQVGRFAGSFTAAEDTLQGMQPPWPGLASGSLGLVPVPAAV